MLKGLPGLQEVMGFFAQFIPGMGRYIEGGKLLAIPNLAMLTPLGLPFLTPLIAKSFLPGIFGQPTPPAGLSQAPQAPTPITADSVDEEEKKRKREEARKKLEEMKKKVGNVVDSAKGAVSGAWNWITGGGDKEDKKVKKGKVIKDALKKKNVAEKGAVQKLVEGERPVMTDDMTIEQQMVVQKKQKLWDMGQQATGASVEKKLKTANEQGGAKAVIESISTTASYDKNETEVVTVPAPKTTVVEDISGAGGGGNAPLVVGGGGEGGADPYESLYKGG